MSSLRKTGILHCFVPHLLALLALLLSLDAAAAGFNARLDRTRVVEGETLVLTLTAPGDSAGSPDPAPLAQDFDLLDQRQSTRMSIVNGHGSTTREWRWLLAPKRSGHLTIPALQLGADNSTPLALDVVPAAQAGKLAAARPVLLEVEAEPQTPYVQGQVVYTVRVLSRVSLRQASLSEPRAGDAIVERLGEDRQYESQRNGQQYQVIERRYAVFPQHSGELSITAPVLSAQIPEQGQRRRGGSLRERLFGHDPFADMDSFFGRDPFADMGGVFGQTRPVQVRGRSLDLEVQPRPVNAASPWLPAESLTLAESWSPDPPVFRVGEPVTRTLAITVQGLTAAQLPDLQPGVPDGIKVYPDKAQGETRADGDTLVAQKVLKSALVPSTAGQLTLPEVRLAWWDTRTGKAQVARLPARTVEVLPAAAGAAVAPPVQAAPSLQPAAVPAGATAPAAPIPDTAGSDTSGLAGLGERLIRASGLASGYWAWLALFLVLAWLVSTLLWLHARRAGPVAGPSPETPVRPVPDPARALKGVRNACSIGAPRTARSALLGWGAARWPDDPPRRIETLAERLGGDAAGVLRELDRILYAADAASWDGPTAWRQLEPILGKAPRKQTRNDHASPLPPLYPEPV